VKMCDYQIIGCDIGTGESYSVVGMWHRSYVDVAICPLGKKPLTHCLSCVDCYGQRHNGGIACGISEEPVEVKQEAVWTYCPEGKHEDAQEGYTDNKE